MSGDLAKIAYTVEQAADAVSISVSTIRRAIRATDPAAFPPPLRARRSGTEKKPGYRILGTELQRWVESWPAA